MMSKRIYNILFHTHTVSGIVISVALYVIFFAGSFSFFRDEIVNWERNHKVETKGEIGVNIDTLLFSVAQQYKLKGRDIEIKRIYNERKNVVNLCASKDSTASKEDQVGAYFYLDTKDKTISTYDESYTLGEFIYRLHFFTQIPYPYGYNLAGFVAFFFLFAIITGVIVHWKKIVSNFYVFRPWAKLKNIWTDSHTALGLIGFPFQLVYALTGAYFMLQSIIFMPYVKALYGGDEQKLHETINPISSTYEYTYSALDEPVSLDNYCKKTQNRWDDFKITAINITNYGDKNMHIAIIGNTSFKTKMNGLGKATYRVVDSHLVSEKNPLDTTTYVESTKNVLLRLHLADYAGYGIRIISFILGILTCYVILSGVMIWLVARDKKNITPKQKKFNEGVVFWYMAICLSMYPMFAFEFLLVKLLGSSGLPFLNKTFFIGWLVFSVIFALKKSLAFTVKWCVILGASLGMLIPIINGIQTGNWFWISSKKEYESILFIDVLWLVLSLLSLAYLFRKNKVIIQSKSL